MLFNELFSRYLEQNESKLNKDLLEELENRANQNAKLLSEEIIKANVLSEEECYINLANFLGIPYRTCQLTELNLDLINKFNREKLIEFECVPFKEDANKIEFLTSNPFRLEEINELKFSVAKSYNFALIIPSQMHNILSYIDNKIQQSQVLDNYVENKTDITEQDADNVTIDAPVIKLCDSLLKEAVSRAASDIHIEPFNEKVRIRYRIDGKLNTMDEVPISMYPAILARFKIMADLNIAERRVPQDGKINLEIDNVKYDFRVSTLPTLYGEKLVIRIYNISYSSENLNALGFSQEEGKLIRDMITRPHGIILLTGPTGSGKSTTLYAFLRNLNKEDTNIITVEDPVENEIAGINQVQVNPKANLTFANALRSILRQDPNIIMIGEIRDEETADIATRAAITGHLVLSSIHTNDAAGVVTRLINMKIPRYLVADSLLAAISQRLVRKLCPKCKKEHITTEAEMKMLNLSEPTTIYEATGCPYCNNTGYFGRTAVFEIMVVDEKVRDIIMNPGFTSEMLNEYLADHMVNLLSNAKKRVLRGETSIEEYEQLEEVIEVKEKVRSDE